MEKIELIDKDGLEIFCPFCGHLCLSNKIYELSQCEHTLYHASDEGFEFVSDKLDFDKDVDLDDQAIYEFLDNLKHPNSFEFRICQPAPSGFCGYLAFARF